MKGSFRTVLWRWVAVFLILVAFNANADRHADAEDRTLVRGGIVYKVYCALCHGYEGNGIARASDLYKGQNLSIGPAPLENYEQIIRLGGQASGLSAFMPPWQDELTDEQIADVSAYLAVIRQDELRGQVVFKTNCVLCHGDNADGTGRASVFYNPKPSNLLTSTQSAAYKSEIITRGGAALGRSATMPPWGLQLKEQEITDLNAYLQMISVTSE
jgi:cytochrome c oxidase cbb3-type subunit III